VRWKGPALALLGAAAVVGIAIGFTLGGGDGTTITDVSGTSTPLIQLPKPGEIRTGHRLIVATVDDAVRQSDPKVAAQLMKISHDAGFDAVMVSSM